MLQPAYRFRWRRPAAWSHRILRLRASREALAQRATLRRLQQAVSIGAIFAGVKILGGVPLDKIFKLVPFGFPGQAGDRVPGLTSVRTTATIGGVSTDVIETRYVWNVGEQQLQQQPIFVPLPNAKFGLERVIDTPLDGKPPQFRVSGASEY